MGINQQQQQPNMVGSGSINYQITPTGTYQQQQQQSSSLNGGIGVIGTSHPITNIVNMNVAPSTTTPHQSNTGTNNNNNNNNSNTNALSLCCLIENGTKCTRNAGNASYSKRIEKQVAQKKLNLIVDHRSSHAYICEHHKQIIQSIRTSGKRKQRKDEDGLMDDDLVGNDFNGTNDSSNEMQQILNQSNHNNMNSNSSKYHHNHHHGHHHHHHSNNHVSSCPIDFHNLQVNTLRKYKRHYRLPVKHGVNKNSLADEVAKHFCTLEFVEKDIINKFMYMIKNGNKSEYNSKND